MVGRSHPYGIILLALLVYPLIFPSCLWGQQKSQKMPPASVSVAKVIRGQVAPQNEFIATIFYQEISDTASEISGLVGMVYFEEGQRVKQNQILVELGSEILRKRLQATTASFEQILSELKIAGIDLKRREKLFSQSLWPRELRNPSWTVLPRLSVWISARKLPTKLASALPVKSWRPCGARHQPDHSTQVNK